MKPYKLVILNANYADEFDVNGFTIMSQDDWKRFETFLLTKNDEIEKYFGTNEALTWSDGQDALNDIETIDITQDETDLIDRLFSISNRGFCPWYIVDGEEL